MRIRTSRMRGFTLAEVLIAAAILAFSVGAVTQAIVYGQMRTYSAMSEARALALAEAMIDEVLAIPYNGSTGNNARGFDHMNDYNNYSENAGSVRDASGNAYPEMYQSYSRSVTITPQTWGVTWQGTAAFNTNEDGRTITVTVQEGGGPSWSITRFVPEPTL